MIRKIAFQLLLFFSLPLSLTAQSDLPVYTIQIGNFLDARATDFQAVAQFGFIYAKSLGNNMQRIYMGGYTKPEEAQQIANVLQTRGYQDATVTQHKAHLGQEVIMVQLATKQVGQAIDWAAYAKAGTLYVYLDNKTVKILTGNFPSSSVAQSRSNQYRKEGFQGAFVTTVNNALLHEIGVFNTGQLPPQPIPAPENSTTDNSGDKKGPPTGEVLPKEYGNESSVIPNTSYIPAEYEALSIVKPTIRVKPKRTSAIELQRVLKELGTYTMSLDGYYGKGTQTAYAEIEKSHPQIQKYALLSAKESQQAADAVPGSLQYAVNNLPNNPVQSLQLFSQYSGPISMIYKAYHFFATAGPSFDVNNLMNTAIAQAFAGKERDPLSRFDHHSSYAYNTIDQLVTHMLHVHAATGNAIQVPCWLFQRHSKTVTEAYEFYPSIAAAGLNIEDCGGLLDWQEIRTLKALARDLNSGEKPKDGLLADAR
ncbi:MAG: hypothetical protein KDC44_11085, partial [Phaeodactylibacter sp.]|nr:hypothetical protein [Phaeodactylibacter sp.]